MKVLLAALVGFVSVQSVLANEPLAEEVIWTRLENAVAANTAAIHKVSDVEFVVCGDMDPEMGEACLFEALNQDGIKLWIYTREWHLIDQDFAALSILALPTYVFGDLPELAFQLNSDKK